MSELIDIKLKAIILIQSYYRSYNVRKSYKLACDYFEQICIDSIKEIKEDIPNYECFKYGNSISNRIDKISNIYLFEVINELEEFKEKEKKVSNNDYEIIDENSNINIINQSGNNNNIEIIPTIHQINENVHDIIDHQHQHQHQLHHHHHHHHHHHNVNDNNKECNNDNNIENELLDTISNNNNNNNNNNNINNNDNSEMNKIQIEILKAEEKFLKKSLRERISLLKKGGH